eukprot:scaffold5907_cov120-Isochrysis_galbana.AAC.2
MAFVPHMKPRRLTRHVRRQWPPCQAETHSAAATLAPADCAGRPDVVPSALACGLPTASLPDGSTWLGREFRAWSPEQPQIHLGLWRARQRPLPAPPSSGRCPPSSRYI